MKQYFLMLPRIDLSIEEILIKECNNVFRINYSISAVYFFNVDSINKELKSFLNSLKEMVFIDITDTEDFLIKMANEEESEALEELICLLKKENAIDLNGVLDKIAKYGESSLTNKDLKILKSI